MAISESQLATWAHQGPTAQFKDTYNTIKNVLEEVHSPYYSKLFEVHLQGSYENDTNVYGDSDVDVVIYLNSSFLYSIDALSPVEQAKFHSAFPTNAPYTYWDFKNDVTSWLTGRFGSGFVTPGTKAVFIEGNGSSRRDADVLICNDYHEYYRFNSTSDELHVPGVKFFTLSASPIANFPKIHSAKCTAKHQGTNNRFKPTVRIFKNMRNRMIEKGLLSEGIAPSYYIEGLLSNVPSTLFVPSHVDTVVSCINWITGCDRSALRCAHGLRPLLLDGKADSWPPAHCATFLSALIKFWNAGG